MGIFVRGVDCDFKVHGGGMGFIKGMKGFVFSFRVGGTVEIDHLITDILYFLIIITDKSSNSCTYLVSWMVNDE